MKKLIVCLLFMISAGLFAQRAGYMGKRFSLNLDMSVYPALYKPVANNQYITASFPYMYWFGINYRITAGADVVVSKKSTVGLDFNYYHTATSIDTSDVAGTYTSVVQEFEAYAIGAHYRVFFGNTKAPIGFYYKVETGATFYHMNNTTALGNFYVNNSFGRQHIFFNHLIINYGLSAGLVMPTFPSYLGTSPNDFPSRLSQAGNFRSLTHFGINIYGGIGVLLF